MEDKGLSVQPLAEDSKGMTPTTGWRGEAVLADSDEDDSWDEDEDDLTVAAESAPPHSQHERHQPRDKRRERVQELASTEKEYVQDLEALLQMADQRQTQIIQLHTLLSNMAQVVEVSRRLQQELIEVSLSSEEVQVGQLFLCFTEELRQVYQEYCSSYSVHVIPLLKIYKESEKAQKELEQLAEDFSTLRPRINSLDAVLIKPVQRILRYPLYVEHLLEDTPTTHPDFPLLREARTSLEAVAKQVDRHTDNMDLVNKYQCETDNSLHAMMNRVSLHSLAKKSVRMSTLLSQRLGLLSQTVGSDLEEVVAKFRCIEWATGALDTHATALLEAVRAKHTAELLISEALEDILPQAPYVQSIKQTTLASCDKALKIFDVEVESRVLNPTRQLAVLCEPPARLISKYRDKKLDYEAAKVKQWALEEVAGSISDKHKAEEEQKEAKAYEALHSLLLAELPVLTYHAQDLLSSALQALASARLYLQGHLAHLYLQLTQVPMLTFVEPKLAQVRVQQQVEWLLGLVPHNLQKKHTFRGHIDTISAGTSALKNKTKAKLTAKDENGSTAQAGRPTIHLRDRFSGTAKLRSSTFRKTSGVSKRRSIPTEYLKGVTSALHRPSHHNHPPARHSVVPQTTLRPERSLEDTYSPEDLHSVTAHHKATQDNELTQSPGATVAILKKSDPTGDQTRWVVSDGETVGLVRSLNLKPVASTASGQDTPHHSICPQPTVSAGLQSLGDSTSPKLPHQTQSAVTQTKMEIHTALYIFTARDASQLSLQEGQLVVPLNITNEDWWYVETEGQQGYVPASYLVPVPDDQ